MAELAIRFAVGGVFVCFFAALGDVFKPKSFAGLFGAAPSVALASLLLTIHKSGVQHAVIDARSMVSGAIAFLVYAWCVCQMLMRRRCPALQATLSLLPVWFAIAFGLWLVWLRPA